MQNDTRRLLAPGLALLFLAAVYVALPRGGNPTCAGDCPDYILLMGLRPWEAAYWEQNAGMFRAWMSVPHLYSLFGAADQQAYERIALAQRIASAGAWLALAWSVGTWLPAGRVRTFGVLAVALGMYSRGYYTFDDNIGSDAFAWSALLAWVAGALTVGRGLPGLGGVVPVAAQVVLTAVAATARDANALLMLTLTPLFLLDRAKEHRPLGLGLVAVTALMFAFATQTSARRSVVNLSNVVAGSVLQREDATDYFVAQGLPAPPRVEWFRIPGAESVRRLVDDRERLFADLIPRRTVVAQVAGVFLMESGRAVYAGWLLSHPAYAFNNVVDSHDLIFEQWRSGSQEGVGTSRALTRCWWMSPADAVPTPLLLAVTWVVLAGSALARRASPLMWAGGMLGLAGALNAVAAFHADVWEASEMARHSFIGANIARLGAITVILAAVGWKGRNHRGGGAPVPVPT